MQKVEPRRMPLYIFGLDGTLVKWEKQEPNWPLVGLYVQLYSVGLDLQIWTGRAESMMEETVMTLFRSTTIRPDILFRQLKMRTVEEDHRDDDELKHHWLKTMKMEDRTRIAAVFESEDDTVKMWRNEGLCCMQVAEAGHLI